MTRCSIEGCNGTGPFVRGWCSKHYQRQRHHGSVDAPITPRMPAWTTEELSNLEEMVDQGLSYETMARRLGRTVTAIKIARTRNDIPPPSRSVLSGQAVARLLGLSCSKRVTYWIRKGWLKGRRSIRFGPHRMWGVQEDDVLKFLENPEHWHRWEPLDISRRELREWALELRGRTIYLTTAEVGARLGVTNRAIFTYIKNGLLPGHRRANWLVKESDLVGFVPPCEQPRPKYVLRRFTVEEDRFVVSERADGKTLPAIASALGRNTSSVHQRLAALQRAVLA